MEHTPRDIELVNETLAGEYFGIAAYEAAIDSGLLEPSVLAVARAFARDHEAHAARLAEVVASLGGTPVGRRAEQDYARERPALNSQAEIVRYAAGLERQAASAHLATVAELNNREAALVEAAISGAEAMHWSALLAAMGENPAPTAFVPLPTDDD